mmetsp:Transcript_20432/g.65402  ORF Transcript_20432/g.65402 Transcript_20432/m.65402 type:complete len:312 (+) Transcript_20432:1186-2121(+)
MLLCARPDEAKHVLRHCTCCAHEREQASALGQRVAMDECVQQQLQHFRIHDPPHKLLCWHTLPHRSRLRAPKQTSQLTELVHRAHSRAQLGGSQAVKQTDLPLGQQLPRLVRRGKRESGNKDPSHVVRRRARGAVGEREQATKRMEHGGHVGAEVHHRRRGGLCPHAHHARQLVQLLCGCLRILDGHHSQHALHRVVHGGGQRVKATLAVEAVDGLGAHLWVSRVGVVGFVEVDRGAEGEGQNVERRDDGLRQESACDQGCIREQHPTLAGGPLVLHLARPLVCDDGHHLRYAVFRKGLHLRGLGVQRGRL